MQLLRAIRAYRHFQRRPAEWRDIVFYAETRQDWHHLWPLVDQLTSIQNRNVCYLTSDPEDPAFECVHERLWAFYMPSGWALTLCFRTLRATVCVLTMMDLDNLQLKRSAFPTHYIYVFHSLGSTHMVDRPDSYDHYDTLLCAGPHQAREIRRREQVAGLPPKDLMPHGYARVEALIEAAPKSPAPELIDGRIPVLLAPTWGPETILPICGEPLIRTLLDANMHVILRPHYETVRQTPAVVEQLKARFTGEPGFEYLDAMGESDSLFRSRLLITDWSAIASEYALALARPVLFIDVPPRIRNPEFERLDLEPLERAIRPRVGSVLPVEALADAPARIHELLARPDAFKLEIDRLREEVVYNLGTSAEVGARSIAQIRDRIAAGAAPDSTASGSTTQGSAAAGSTGSGSTASGSAARDSAAHGSAAPGR